jgi:hypothetical protein
MRDDRPGAARQRLSLHEIQRRFFGAVTGAHGEARDTPLAAWLEFPDEAVARRRVSVYRDAYAYRLVDALREDYPATAAALGGAFDEAARGYVVACPPRTPCLVDFGDAFAAFLSEHAAARERPWVAELAALERARVRVFHADGGPLLAASDLASIPEDAWPAHVFVLAESARVLSFTHAVDDSWHAADERRAVEPPARRSTVVAVFRHPLELVSCHRVLDGEEAAALLRVLAGAPFADVCECFASGGDVHGTGGAAERALASLLAWISVGLLGRGN